jgi:hypothetical protein
MTSKKSIMISIQAIGAGKYGFTAQLNESRQLKKRHTEFRVKVLQFFNKNKFYFTKIGQEEVLFQFEPSMDAFGFLCAFSDS